MNPIAERFEQAKRHAHRAQGEASSEGFTGPPGLKSPRHTNNAATSNTVSQALPSR